MSFTSQQVWDTFYKKLVEQAVPHFDNTKQAVSLAGTTLSTDLVNGDSEITNASIYNIGNMLPAQNPTYAPGGDLITSYSLFLQNIDLGGDPNPDLKDKINIAAGNLTKNQNNFIDVQSKAFDAYLTYKKVNPSAPDADTWLNANYPLYAAAKSSLNGANSQYDTLMTQAYGAGYSTIQAAQAAVSSITGAKSLTVSNAYNMPVKVGSVAPDGTQQVLPGETPPAASSSLKSTFRPAFELGGSLPKVFSSWQTASVNKDFPISFDLTGDFSTASSRDFGWKESVQASYRSWFSVKVDQQASYESVTESWKNSSFDCKVSFNGLQSFPINADANWFSSGIVQNYKDKLLSTSPQFFGEDGSLHVIPTAIILGYGLKVTIKVDNASFNSFKSAFQQSAKVSIGVGPFSFGGSESSHLDKNNFTYDADSSTIEINPAPTGVPLLLGVVSNTY